MSLFSRRRLLGWATGALSCLGVGKVAVGRDQLSSTTAITPLGYDHHKRDYDCIEDYAPWVLSTKDYFIQMLDEFATKNKRLVHSIHTSTKHVLELCRWIGVQAPQGITDDVVHGLKRAVWDQYNVRLLVYPHGKHWDGPVAVEACDFLMTPIESKEWVSIPHEPTEAELFQAACDLAKAMLPKEAYYFNAQYHQQLREGYVIPFKFSPPSEEHNAVQAVFDWFKHLVLHVEKVQPNSVGRFFDLFFNVLLIEAMHQTCGYDPRTEAYTPVGAHPTVTPRYCKDTEEIIKHGPQMFAEMVWGAVRDIVAYRKDHPEAVICDVFTYTKSTAYMLEFFCGVYRTDGKDGSSHHGITWQEDKGLDGSCYIPAEGLDTRENFQIKMAQFCNAYGEQPSVLTMTQTGFAFVERWLFCEPRPLAESAVGQAERVGRAMEKEFGLQTRMISYSWHQPNYATLDGKYALAYPKQWGIAKHANGDKVRGYQV